MKKSFSLFAMLLLPLSAVSFAGQPKQGTFGLGWYSASAPVGGRVWVSPMVGVDLGLGFADKYSNPAAAKERFHVNVGVPVNVVTTEPVNFFIRPGLEFQTQSRTVDNEVKSTIIISADLGAEWFVSDQFSLSVGHGLQIQQVGGTDDNWSITALRALSMNNVGFHFYFK